jgi:L-lactate utilization protein LutB
MYEEQNELTAFIKQLKTLRNEVVVLHVMGKNELEFNYNGNIVFEDLETGAKVKINATDAKKKYIQSLNKMMKNTKDMLLANGISYHLMSLDANIGETIELFLKKRNRLV